MKFNPFNGADRLQKFCLRLNQAPEPRKHEPLRSNVKYFTLIKAFGGEVTPMAFHITEKEAAGLITHAKKTIERVEPIPGCASTLFGMPEFRLEVEA